MQYVSSMSYSILLNGKASEQFNPSRGLRQRDLLSPYIFILCVEELSSLLRRSEQNGGMGVFQLGKEVP